MLKVETSGRELGSPCSVPAAAQAIPRYDCKGLAPCRVVKTCEDGSKGRMPKTWQHPGSPKRGLRRQRTNRTRQQRAPTGTTRSAQTLEGVLASLIRPDAEYSCRTVPQLVAHTAQLATATPPSVVKDNLLRQIVPHLQIQVQEVASGLCAQDYAHCIQGLAAMKFVDVEVLQQLVEQSKPHLQHWHAQQLAETINSLPALNIRPSNAWLASCMMYSHRRLQEMNTHSLSILLSGLVRLGLKPSSLWLGFYLDEVEARMSCFQARELVTIVSALADAKHSPSDQWLAIFYNCSHQGLSQMDAEATVSMVWAVSTLSGSPPQHWLRGVLVHLVEDIPDLSSWHVSTCFKALATIMHQGDGSLSQSDRLPQGLPCKTHLPDPAITSLLQPLFAAVANKLPAFSARDLSDVMAALGLLQGPCSASCLEVVRRIDHVLVVDTAKMSRFSTGGLCLLLSTFSDLCYSPSSAFLEAFYCTSMGKLSVFSSSDLQMTVRALSRMNVSVPQFWLDECRAQLCRGLPHLPSSEQEEVTRALQVLQAGG